ncbi:MAG: hypothetical protein ACYS4W_03145 [Planctomycetota bacterium]|jgi:prepilin-type processing-associated H-X9-DG protein
MSEKTKGWLVAVWSILLGVIALLVLLTADFMYIAFALTGLAVGVFGLRLTEGSSARGVRVTTKVGIGINGLLVSVLLVVSVVWLVGLFLPHRPGPVAYRTVCMSNLHGLAKAMMVYARHTGGTSYPTPDKWCDLLLEQDYVTERQFICKAGASQGDTGRCHYAMNPECDPNSPGDTVLLFETKGGWNQYGGPEMLTMEHHEGKGCNILFNDGSIKFVQAEEVGELKWKVEQAKP